MVEIKRQTRREVCLRIGFHWQGQLTLLDRGESESFKNKGDW